MGDDWGNGADIMLTIPNRISSVRMGIEPATHSKPSLSPSTMLSSDIVDGLDEEETATFASNRSVDQSGQLPYNQATQSG